MPKCRNCGEWTEITDDLICPYCEKPMVTGEATRTLKRHQRILKDVEKSIEILNRIGVEPPDSVKERYETLKIGFVSIIYLILIIDIEFVAFFISPTYGIICSFVLLLVLIVNASVVPANDSHKFLIALGLIPLIRIVSLAVPIPQISEIYWYIIIAVPIMAAIVTVFGHLEYSLDEIGLNGKRPLVQIIAALTGIGLGIVNYSILRPEPLVGYLDAQTIWAPALILIIATGFQEEIIFRGILQKASGVLGRWGWVYVAVVYGALQIGYQSLYHGMFAFIIAILFGWIVKKTGSIIGVSISHGLINVGLFLIYPHLGWYFTIHGVF